MQVNTATSICFSPTGTTAQVVNAIIKGMGITKVQNIDLTKEVIRRLRNPVITGDIVIIGAPVHVHMIPEMVIPFLEGLKCQNKPVVLVAVYGNMDEGMVLGQLNSIMGNNGFKTVGAATFVGEHSFSTRRTPLAIGRPDQSDLKKAREFGQKLIVKMQSGRDIDDMVCVLPQGKEPGPKKSNVSRSAKIISKSPKVNREKCSECGQCVKACPANSITAQTLVINNDKCIRCFACVRTCDQEARKIEYRPQFLLEKLLQKKCDVRKEPNVYC